MKTSVWSTTAVFSVLLLSQALPAKAEEPTPAGTTGSGEQQKEEPKVTSAETMKPEWYKKAARQTAGTAEKEAVKKADELTKAAPAPETPEE